MPEMNEDMGKTLKLMSDTLKRVSDDHNATKIAQEKIKQELTTMIGNVKDEVSTIKADVSVLAQKSEEDAEIEKSVYDLALKGKNSDSMLARLGFHSDLDAALYKSNLKYDARQRRWTKSGSGYGVDENIALMNDMIFLYGMGKALNSAFKGEPQSYQSIVKGLDVFNIMRHEMRRDSALRKAMDLTANADWVPTGMSAQLLDDIRLNLKVASLFRTAQMPAGSGSWDVPVRGSALGAYLVAENTADTGQTPIGARTPSSGKITFTAIKHALRILMSYEIDEDSIVALMPFIREEIVYALANSAENAIINGDTTATHMDSDVVTATDVQKSFLGLRKHSGNSAGDAAVDISTLSTANLRAIRKAMGKYGVNSADLAWITGVSGFVQMMSLSDVLTVDKIGSMATILSGQLASFDGAPVIVSEHMKEDMNASGVVDGITETKTEILLANTRAFWNAEKPSGIRVETDRNIENQQLITVASRRFDFKRSITPASGYNVVGVGYNLTT